MNKRVKERVTAELERMGNVQKSDVVSLIKIYDEAPDINKLIEKYYSEKANRFMASFKDEKNIRNCYAVKNPDNSTKYIDLTKPLLNNKKDVEAVKKGFQGKNKANMLTIIKADLCAQIIIGQVSMEEYQEELSKRISEM